MLLSSNLIYGGKSILDKKDVETKKPTGEKSYIFNLLEKDEEKGVVNFIQFFRNEDIDTTNIKLFETVKVDIEINITSKATYKELINLTKIK